MKCERMSEGVWRLMTESTRQAVEKQIRPKLFNYIWDQVDNRISDEVSLHMWDVVTTGDYIKIRR